jgi:hypothetical protein
MLAHELFGSDELPDLANAQVVGTDVHSHLLQFCRATQAKKKPPVPAVFLQIVLSSAKSVERSPPTAKVDWPKIVCKAIAAG